MWINQLNHKKIKTELLSPQKSPKSVLYLEPLDIDYLTLTQLFEPGAFLKMFLVFKPFEPWCSYKLVLIKNN